MRRQGLAAVLALAAGAAWVWSASGEEGAEAPELPPVEEAPAIPSETDVEVSGVEDAAPSPGTITPPLPLPEVEIPPIAPVGPDPFKPRELPPPRPAGTPLLEEGKRLFNREGRLELDDEGEPVFVLDDTGIEPLSLLRNSWREYLESVTGLAKKESRWRVSGLVTRYHNRNYLLLHKCVRIMPEEEGL